MRKLHYETILNEIRNLSLNSSIYVGCDSKLTGPYTLFGLVIILHIESTRGGMCFATKMRENRRMGMNERLMKEVEHAVICASQVQPFVGNRKFEVHLDISPYPEHKSYNILNTAIGYVKGQGLVYKIKPGAFAASTAADYLIS